MPWLWTQHFISNASVHIDAGVSLERFVKPIDLAGGHVFAPLGWTARPLESEKLNYGHVSRR